MFEELFSRAPVDRCSVVLQAMPTKIAVLHTTLSNVLHLKPPMQ